MSQAKHTPGPWKATGNEFDKLLGYSVKDRDGIVVAEIQPRPYQVHVNKQNARLIAAAPEMLEALECALIGLEQVEDPLIETSDALVAVREALKKARGE
jgi:hypothetical protein